MVNRLKKYFFSGLAVFLPLGLTIQVFLWALKFADNILGNSLRPYFEKRYDFYFPGLGIVLLVVIIFLCGFLVTHYFGRVIHRGIESLMMRIPIIATIYSAFKEVAKFLFKEEDLVNKGPQQVVMVQWPGLGVYTIGFLTNQTPNVICDAAGQKLVNVLIPTVPNPITGFVLMFPLDQVKRLDMSVEDAIKIIVSGGVVDPYAISSDEKVPAKS
jgi:uncharacterized membrane protein